MHYITAARNDVGLGTVTTSRFLIPHLRLCTLFLRAALELEQKTRSQRVLTRLIQNLDITYVRTQPPSPTTQIRYMYDYPPGKSFFFFTYKPQNHCIECTYTRVGTTT